MLYQINLISKKTTKIWEIIQKKFVFRIASFQDTIIINITDVLQFFERGFTQNRQ